MKTLRSCPVVILLILAVHIFYADRSIAQNTITHTITRQSGNFSTGYGRDFWFAIPQNADANDHSQKYFDIYVSSLRNTTVNFQVGSGVVIKKSVTAGK